MLTFLGILLVFVGATLALVASLFLYCRNFVRKLEAKKDEYEQVLSKIQETHNSLVTGVAEIQQQVNKHEMALNLKGKRHG